MGATAAVVPARPPNSQLWCRVQRRHQHPGGCSCDLSTVMESLMSILSEPVQLFCNVSFIQMSEWSSSYGNENAKGLLLSQEVGRRSGRVQPSCDWTACIS